MEEIRETLDIETAGDTVALNIMRDDVLGVYIRNAGAAEFSLDVSDSDTNWIEDAETFTGPDVNYGGFEGAQWVRVRVTAGTGTAGDTADVLVASSGR